MSTANVGKTRSIGKEFFRYALPSVLGMVVSSLYTVIDGIFVGRGVGENALAAVNIVFPFIMLQIALAMMVATGGANLFSFSKGRQETDTANNVFCQSIGLIAGISLVINLVAIIFAPQLCSLLGADNTLLPLSQVYMRWMALFGIAFMPGMGLSIFVRNDNSPYLEMIGTLSGAIANIFLDYLFIMVFEWGVAGAAIASGIGQMISVAIYTTHFLNKKRTLQIKIPKFIKENVKKIFQNGFSTFLMEFSQSAIALSFNIVLMKKVGPMGVSAYSIVMYICSIFNMVLIGINHGAQPIMSYNHGAEREDNVNKVYRMGMTANLVITTVFYGAILLFGSQLASIFNPNNATLTAMAFEMMKYYFLGFFPIGISLMNILYFQTTELEGKSIVISFLRCVGFVQLFLLILPSFMDMKGIYLAYFLGELGNAVISMILYRSNKMKIKCVKAEIKSA